MNDFRKNMLKLVLVLVGVIVVLVLVITLATGSGRTTSYTEKGLVNAAKNYYRDNANLLPIEDYEEATVNDDTLISLDFLNEYKDENDNIVSCSSKVTVTKIKDEYYYQPYLFCNNEDDTTLLYEQLVSNVVTEEDGLYKISNEYYYKGENPNNYITFADKTWRIIKIDEENNIKLIMQDSDYDFDITWDDRYNLIEESSTGINDYTVSRIKDVLEEELNDSKVFTNSDLSMLAKIDLCIGKRSDTDKTTNGNTECSKKLESQLIGLVQLNEYFIASNDPNCLTKSVKSCQNYNYLSIPTWTITGYSGDTSRVWFITTSSNSIIRLQTNESMRIAPVVTLKSNSIYSEGDGTESNPYIVR